jgi:ribosomal protein S18 acetylase RimI-like enzyme
MAAALFEKNTPAPLFALVAQMGEEVVGVLLYYTGYDTLSASYGYHLADIVVTKAHRALGVGRALVKALATQTLAEHKEWVSLTVLKRNSAAHEFYTALGMMQVDVDFFAMGKNALAQL